MSSQPRKQRLRLYQAPIHVRRKNLSARLSDELRKEYGRKTIPIRKGDTVLVVRGDHVGHEGKVVEVDPEKGRIKIEGLTVTRADGTTRLIPVHASKVIITKLDLSDKWRKEKLESSKR
ncbi:MAG: 50S ribosomal protein L24 [Candidatus Methanomethylicota archaeon]|uniref:Large ribosomal subunit protein uL24 n=1 Tax=Thermoproteota archaeon TaxID=2056631 RepID=A0A497EYS3_9CREN|nr:MAG: 50S ribosomal protein L24 [Candidatus Verstraetearchaeota archaeon]RLE52533.1 MAG: 50S ribosomal protein L24 [Candidatus Verstraetearchaeota archaeon]